MKKMKFGNYGPYKQSLRKEIYQAYAKHLIEKGYAYPCFCKSEELEEMRKKQEMAKERTGYYGVWSRCRHIPVNEQIEKIKNGEIDLTQIKNEARQSIITNYNMEKMSEAYLKIYEKGDDCY